MAARSLFHIPELCTCIAEAVPERHTTNYTDTNGQLAEKTRLAQLAVTRRTLVRLARSSKTFKEPALNALWRDLEDFGAVARLLPAEWVTVSWGARGQRRMGLAKWVSYHYFGLVYV